MSRTPSYSRQPPRRRVIGVGSRSSVWAANLPSATRTRGRIAAICARRKGSHASSSSGSGFPLSVLVRARPLADEHQLGRRVADAEDQVRPPARELAARALTQLPPDREE